MIHQENQQLSMKQDEGNDATLSEANQSLTLDATENVANSIIEEEDTNIGVDNETFIEGRINDDNTIQPVMIDNNNIIVIQDEDLNSAFFQVPFDHVQILSEEIEGNLEQALLTFPSDIFI